MQVREHATATPDKPAIILHPTGTTVTFGDLETRANQLAHSFRRAGLVEGDAIAILMENNEHMHAVMWAARRVGLYYVPINTHLTAAEAAYILDDCDAKALMASPAMKTLCQTLGEQFPQQLPPLRLIADCELAGWQRYPDCVAGEPTVPVDGEAEGELLQYSSGTTGRPKGIRRPLTHLSPSESPNLASVLLTAIGMSSDSVYLSPAPLYHTAPCGWTMSAQAMGVTTVIMERFDPEQALEAIERHSVTAAQFVPAMFVRMLKLDNAIRGKYELSSLQRVVHAAAPCPVTIKRQMIDWWGPIIDEYYSSSEGAGITFISAENWIARPGTVGRPLLGVVHIVGDDGAEVPPGVSGQIYFDLGPAPFEYHNDAKKTAESRGAHGWVTVGDIGHIDEDGFVFLTDRKHFTIISGGVNIYPREIEDVLVTHPKVMDAAVFGIPDEEMGQSVKGVVQTVEAADANDELADELLRWTRERLAPYKCPRSISFELDFPRSDTGKLYKQELVRKYSSVG